MTTHQTRPSTRTTTITRIATAAIVALTVILVAGCSSSSHAASKASGPTPTTLAGSGGSYHGPTIVVQGTGEVKGTPDTATVSLGVQTTGPTAQAAMADNSQRATALIAVLKAKKVAARDIQTSNLSISPNYDLKGHITGYGVGNTLTATLRDIKGAGDLIDAAAAFVGDAITVNGVQFSIDDTSALTARARDNAVKQAITRARQLAKAAGVKLGAVRKIEDVGTALPTPQFLQGSPAFNKAASTPIEAGSQQLSVDVSVVFAVSG